VLRDCSRAQGAVTDVTLTDDVVMFDCRPIERSGSVVRLPQFDVKSPDRLQLDHEVGQTHRQDSMRQKLVTGQRLQRPKFEK